MERMAILALVLLALIGCDGEDIIVQGTIIVHCAFSSGLDTATVSVDGNTVTLHPGWDGVWDLNPGDYLIVAQVQGDTLSLPVTTKEGEIIQAALMDTPDPTLPTLEIIP